MPNNIYVCFMCKKKFKDEEWLNGVTDYNICQDCIFQTNAVCYDPHTINTINSINSINSIEKEKTKQKSKQKYKRYSSMPNLKRTKSVCQNLSTDNFNQTRQINLRQRNRNEKEKLLNNNKNIEKRVDCSYILRYLRIFK